MARKKKMAEEPLYTVKSTHNHPLVFNIRYTDSNGKITSHGLYLNPGEVSKPLTEDALNESLQLAELRREIIITKL